MSTTGGLDLVARSGSLNLQLAATASAEQKDVARLSSGLRIETAADDPSGLAIADGLQAKVNGYDRAVSDVQDTTNALTVADGALQTINDVLQRLRTLAVEANDDLLSADDRSNLQTESAQLQAQISSIAQNTNFNGLGLLDGNADVLQPAPTVADGTFSNPDTGSLAYDPAGTPWTFSSFAGVISSTVATAAYSALPPPSGASQMGIFFGLVGTQSMHQTVAGFAAEASYTLSFNMSQNTDNFVPLEPQEISVSIDGTQIASFIPDPASPTTAWTAETTPAFTPGPGPHTITLTATDPDGPAFGSFVDDVQLEEVANDFEPTTFQTQSGAVEGNVTTVDVPGVTAADIGISGDDFLSTADAASYETDIDTAISTVGTARATIGAQMVALQYQAANDQTAGLNLTAAESNIRDLDVAQATTDFARDQILSSIGISVLSNTTNMAASVERLFQ
jgi:flagellin